MKLVGVECLPDMDGDGFPEAVITLIHPGQAARLELRFLASRRADRWRVFAAIGMSGQIPGVEGSFETSVQFVTLADRRPALLVKRTMGGGGDCDCASEKISVATLEHGKLRERNELDTGRPCACLYAGSD